MAIEMGYKKNFDTLSRAFRNGDVALMKCRDRVTQKPVMAVCAVNHERNGDVSFAPLAKLFDGNPYEELHPPE